MDMKFLQAILGHLNPLNTLASYVEPDMEDVKRSLRRWISRAMSTSWMSAHRSS